MVDCFFPTHARLAARPPDSAAIFSCFRNDLEQTGHVIWRRLSANGRPRALGATRAQAPRLVILPQALRTISPIIASSWLSLTKSSNLAVAIGYPDLVSILNTTANVTGQALEAILSMMAVYLSLSLATSYLMTSMTRRNEMRTRRSRLTSPLLLPTGVGGWSRTGWRKSLFGSKTNVAITVGFLAFVWASGWSGGFRSVLDSSMLER